MRLPRPRKKALRAAIEAAETWKKRTKALCAFNWRVPCLYRGHWSKDDPENWNTEYG